MSQKYLHGYTKEEQKRLYTQAQLLEPFVYDFIQLKKQKNVLEIGCGVGAQTAILFKRFPHLKITGVDISPEQLATATYRLKKWIQKNKLELIQADASQLPLKNATYDAAFICWFLEHVPNPNAVLKEAYKKLKPGSIIYCSEVQNAGVFVHPYSPAILKYWYEYNDVQWEENGHPFIGARLGNLLKNAGFKKIEHSTQVMLFDSRNMPLRRKYMKWMKQLFYSALPLLKQHGRISDELLLNVDNEFKILESDKNAVIFFPFCRAKAIKP